MGRTLDYAQIAEERRNLFSLPDFLRELSVTH